VGEAGYWVKGEFFHFNRLIEVMAKSEVSEVLWERGNRLIETIIKSEVSDGVWKRINMLIKVMTKSEVRNG